MSPDECSLYTLIFEQRQSVRRLSRSSEQTCRFRLYRTREPAHRTACDKLTKPLELERRKKSNAGSPVNCCKFNGSKIRAVSSIGRAFGLHPKGHRFEPYTAHPSNTNHLQTKSVQEKRPKMGLYLTSDRKKSEASEIAQAWRSPAVSRSSRTERPWIVFEGL